MARRSDQWHFTLYDALKALKEGVEFLQLKEAVGSHVGNKAHDDLIKHIKYQILFWQQ